VGLLFSAAPVSAKTQFPFNSVLTKHSHSLIDARRRRLRSQIFFLRDFCDVTFGLSRDQSAVAEWRHVDGQCNRC
jgi:hypothetical protein